MIKPKMKLLMKIMGQNVTRKKLAVILLPIILASFILIGVTEPESVKQARLASEHQQQVDDQKAKDVATAQAHKTVAPTKVETKTVTEKKPVDFAVETRDDATLPKGQTKIVQAGVKGEKTFTYKVTYTNGRETIREQLSELVTKMPVSQITANGTYVYVAPAPTPTPTPASSNAYYANCTAARAAGAAPLYVGEPGYRSALDRDNDGVACE